MSPRSRRHPTATEPPPPPEPSRLPWFTPGRFLAALTVLVLAYFAFTAVENFIQAYQLQREEEAIRQDIARLEQRYYRLLALREYFASDEFIEMMARQVLGWVRPGEPAIIAISSQQPADAGAMPSPSETAPASWWEAYFDQR